MRQSRTGVSVSENYYKCSLFVSPTARGAYRFIFLIYEPLGYMVNTGLYFHNALSQGALPSEQ